MNYLGKLALSVFSCSFGSLLPALWFRLNFFLFYICLAAVPPSPIFHFPRNGNYFNNCALKSFISHLHWHTLSIWFLFLSVSHHIKSHNIISYYTIILYHIILSYHIISSHIILYYIILYHITSYHTIIYYTISFHIIPYHII